HRVLHSFPTRRSSDLFVVAEFEQTRPYVDDLQVTLHEVVKGSDGSYDFDATIRYTLAGLDFLVLVEAKRHHYPIKRDVVQTLHRSEEHTSELQSPYDL